MKTPTIDTGKSLREQPCNSDQYRMKPEDITKKSKYVEQLWFVHGARFAEYLGIKLSETQKTENGEVFKHDWNYWNYIRIAFMAVFCSHKINQKVGYHLNRGRRFLEFIRPEIDKTESLGLPSFHELQTWEQAKIKTLRDDWRGEAVENFKLDLSIDHSERISELEDKTIEEMTDEQLQFFCHHKKAESDLNRFGLLEIECGGETHLWAKDQESAKASAKEYIEESVWAFNASFLSAHSKGVDEEVFEKLSEGCESSNDAIKKLIDDMDHFVDDAIIADGLGHFIATYDGNETYREKVGYFYRID
jgi:hypothetical protein